MKEKDCVICYKACSTKTDSKSKAKRKNVYKGTSVQETEEKCVTLDNQLPVIFLLRKLLNIPEEMCTKFLQNNGNPVSWIFLCDDCAKLISDAELVFKEIQQLQKKLNSVCDYIKNTIVLSADTEENSRKTEIRDALKKTKHGPAKEIRSYIIQEFRSLQNSNAEIVIEDDNEVDIEMDTETENIDEFINSTPLEDCTSQETKRKCKPRSCLRSSIKEEDENEWKKWKPEETSEDSDSSSEENVEDFDSSYEPEETPVDLQSDISKDISEEQTSKIGSEKAAEKRNGLLKCEICFLEYSALSTLRRHFSLAHGKFPYSCERCKYKMVSKEELEKHKKFGCEKKFFCDICNKGLAKRYNLMKHREVFHGIKEEKKIPEEIVLKCQKCDEVYTRFRELRSHCKKMHSEDFEKLYPKTEENACTICGLTFSCSWSTKQHYKSKHLEEFKIKFPGCKKPNEFKCTAPNCNYKAITNQRIQAHMKTHSPIKEPKIPTSVCDICGDSFTEKKYLEFHQTSKHYKELGLNPFKCDHCGKKFNSPFTLRAHIKTVHQNSFKFTCPICSQGVNSKCAYDVHMKRHEGIKTALCPECGATFLTQGELNGHIGRVHRTDRPFVCKQCSKTFKCAEILRRHVKSVHSDGVKPYKCQFCPKSFSMKYYLNIHMRSKSHRKMKIVS